MCAMLGVTILFSHASGSFKCGWLVYNKEGRKSWGLYPFSPDVVDTCIYGFIRLAQHTHGAVKITCYFLVPEK